MRIYHDITLNTFPLHTIKHANKSQWKELIFMQPENTSVKTSLTEFVLQKYIHCKLAFNNVLFII